MGVGVNAPVEKLEVNGNLKTNFLTIANGGFLMDFLVKNTESGTTDFRKGQGAMGMQYIICVQGIFPQQNAGGVGGPYLGEIKAFSGNFAPTGWMFCHGQFLKDTIPNRPLLSIIGRTFGGTDTTFALPDLRGLSPIGVGTSPAGYSWSRAQKSN